MNGVNLHESLEPSPCPSSFVSSLWIEHPQTGGRLVAMSQYRQLLWQDQYSLHIQRTLEMQADSAAMLESLVELDTTHCQNTWKNQGLEFGRSNRFPARR